MSEKRKDERKYAGSPSKKFWERIAAIQDEKLHSAAYIAGCALQDHEARVLQMLREIEREPAA